MARTINPMGGLSPRGRGKRKHPGLSLRYSGSIPAWAGETEAAAGSGSGITVYPRVGGGNLGSCILRALVWGLSPRGRGKLCRRTSQGSRPRSIPAWAGETARRTITDDHDEVYPRVGGGNRRQFGHRHGVAGLSPRGRGKRLGNPPPVQLRRSIPAWAGETRGRRRCRPLYVVYPRVGGGNLLWRSWPMTATGLSPRGRGKLGMCPPSIMTGGSIPAWAGETTFCGGPTGWCWVYPRVGGGNGGAAGGGRRRGGLSPRGRGKPVTESACSTLRRSIPAWAGETGPAA